MKTEKVKEVSWGNTVILCVLIFHLSNCQSYLLFKYQSCSSHSPINIAHSPVCKQV